MSCSYDLPQMHQRAKASVANIRKDFGGQFEADKDVMTLLRDVEGIRAAVLQIIEGGGADLAVDLLLCVVGETRRMEMRRTSDLDRQRELFLLCRDDDAMHAFIYRWLCTREDWKA